MHMHLVDALSGSFFVIDMQRCAEIEGGNVVGRAFALPRLYLAGMGSNYAPVYNDRFAWWLDRCARAIAGHTV